MRYKVSNLIWGVLLLVLGIGFLGNALDIWHFTLFFNGWWTLFLILPATLGLIQHGYSLGRLIMLAAGLLCFANAQGFLPIRPSKLILPFFLIGLGVLLFSGIILQKRSLPFEQDPTPAYVTIFSDNHVRNDSRDFRNGSATCVFGDMNVDLRDAACVQDAYFQATSVFGDVKIKVPSSVRLDVHPFSLFGDFKNKADSKAQDIRPVLHINCTSIFGEIILK